MIHRNYYIFIKTKGTNLKRNNKLRVYKYAYKNLAVQSASSANSKKKNVMPSNLN